MKVELQTTPSLPQRPHLRAQASERDPFPEPTTPSGARVRFPDELPDGAGSPGGMGRGGAASPVGAVSPGGRFTPDRLAYGSAHENAIRFQSPSPAPAGAYGGGAGARGRAGRAAELRGMAEQRLTPGERLAERRRAAAEQPAPGRAVHRAAAAPFGGSADVGARLARVRAAGPRGGPQPAAGRRAGGAGRKGAGEREGGQKDLDHNDFWSHQPKIISDSSRLIYYSGPAPGQQ
jgi:hypothetical protein